MSGWERMPSRGADEGFAGGHVEDAIAGGPGLIAVGSDADADAAAARHRFGGLVATVGGVPMVRPRTSDKAEPDDRAAAVWTSVDGRGWSRVRHDPQVFGGTGTQRMTAVTTGGPGVVAVGGESFRSYPDAPPPPRGLVWVSADGLSWQRAVDQPAFADSYILDLTRFGELLVAVGGGPGGRAAVWLSDDGILWSRREVAAVYGTGSTATMLHVAAGPDGLVAIGTVSDEPSAAQRWAVWTSVDGVEWAQGWLGEGIPGELGDGEVTDLVAGGPGLVAVGTIGAFGPQRSEGSFNSSFDAAVWLSADGRSWRLLRHDEAVLGGLETVRMDAIAVTDHGLVAVGEERASEVRRSTALAEYFDGAGHGAIWTSSDGEHWARVRHDAHAFGPLLGDEGATERSFAMSAVTEGPTGVVVLGGSEDPSSPDDDVLEVWVGGAQSP